MLPPEPVVIDGRQGFADAQTDFAGSATPLGNYYVSWYGTNTSDERGSFAVVNPFGALSTYVGDFLQVVYRGRSVIVYVIGSFNGLTTDLGLARRPYLAICRPSLDPIFTPVELIT
jgi:hypothetical protein